MLHFSPRALPLCVGSVLSRYSGFATALTSLLYSRSTPAYDNVTAGGSGAIGGSIDVSGRKHTEGFCCLSTWTNFSSRWNCVITALSGSTSTTEMMISSTTERHAIGESMIFLRYTPLCASGSGALFTTTADPATRRSAMRSETDYSSGKMYHRSLEAAPVPVAKKTTATRCTGSSETGREAVTAAVAPNGVVKVKSAASRVARVTTTLVLKRRERIQAIAAETAQGSLICAANRPAAASEQQRSDLRWTTDAAVARVSGGKRTLRISRNVTAAALQGVTSVGGIQACGACAVYLSKCSIAPGPLQAPATCCYMQEKREDRIIATAGGTAASQRKMRTTKARRSYSSDDECLVDAPPLSTEQAERSQKVATTCGFVQTRYKYNTAPESRVGRGFPCIFIKNPFRTSLGDRVKKLIFLSLPGSRESGRSCASATEAQNAESRPSAAASLPKHDGDHQGNNRDRAQEQVVFQRSPRGQALLGLLAAMGACFSLVLLYERSLLDSAALLYGAWDAEWDASWRASSEQYEAELIAKGAQALACVAGDPASGGAEMTAASLGPPTRQIILVRHGQYQLAGTDEERGLTDLGTRQAEAVGRRLRELLQGQHVQAIVHSSMKRARETANIIQEAGAFKAVPLVEDALLAEGAPAEPVPPSDTFWPSPTDIAMDSPRIERAFRRYFYRARSPPTAGASSCPVASDKLFPVSQENADFLLASAKGKAAANTSANFQSPQHVLLRDSCIILVCHGNVIRYFLMRAPPVAYVRLAPLGAV